MVDEFDREYKRLQRPADAVAKTDRSLQLSDTLREASVDDDRKEREYVAALHRYLNVGKEVPQESISKVCRDLINSISFLSEVNVKSRVVVYGAAF